MTREEAIKAIKAWDFLDKDEKEAIETLIPELVESEDEKISREITEFILTHRLDEPNDIEDTNSWLVWLGKQGEQKAILDELEMTLSVSEDAYLRNNLEKLIKEFKEEQQ